MDIDPDIERLVCSLHLPPHTIILIQKKVSTIFLLFNASGLLLYTSEKRVWRPQIVIALLISVVGAWLLLHKERKNYVFLW